MADNIFDQFDVPTSSQTRNIFDQFDAAKPVEEKPPARPTTIQSIAQSDEDHRLALKQGVNPNSTSQYFPNAPQRLGDLEEFEWGQGYKLNGEEKFINPKSDFVARDPETGKMAVYARNKDTNESAGVTAARDIVSGLVTGPVAGIQRAAQAGRAVATTLPETSGVLATQRATEAVRDAQAFDSLGVRKFGPAFNQGPVASVAKQLTETPFVGAPLKNALDDSLRGAAEAAESVAGRYGSAATPETAGAAVRTGLERFRDARPAEIVERTAEGYSPAQLSEIIRAPARDTSLKTKQAALYQRAWDLIPEEMQAGRAVEGLPRIVGDMPNARALLTEIEGRNMRMINASREGADAAAKPVAAGGLAGRMVDAMMNTKWRAALQSMRDVRSNFRRLASGIGDTEKNTMQLSDLDRLQSAITRDMIGLMERNVSRYREIGRLNEARDIERAILEFRRADTFTRASAQRMETLEKLFNAPSAEALYRNVAAAALSKGRGDLQKLRVLRKTLQSDEMGDVAAAVIRQMGEPVGSARGVTQDIGFSVSSFLTRWQNMAPEARHLLFGGEHTKALDDLVRVVSRLANVEALANTSRSGTNALNMSGVLGGIGALATGQWQAAAAIGGAGLASSVLMSRPAYVRLATEYAALRAAALRAPSSELTPKLISHVQRLAELAKHDADLLPVLRAVSEEFGIKQGSQEQNEQQGKVRH